MGNLTARSDRKVTIATVTDEALHSSFSPFCGEGSRARLRRACLEAYLRRRLELHAPDHSHYSRPVRDLIVSIHELAFDRSISVRALKARCRVSDNNVSCRFKSEVGVSIRDHVEILRLEAARDLLRLGIFTAAEVADAVGYTYLQTFYRAFKKRFKHSPGTLVDPPMVGVHDGPSAPAVSA